MKKILTVFGTFIVVTAVFLGLTNMDEINNYLNKDEVSEDTLALDESTESNEWTLEENETEVEAFVKNENTGFTEGERPEKGERPEDFDGERPLPPEDGAFPEQDTHTGATSTTTE